MRKSIITSMLMLCAMSCWAQGTKTPVNDSICVFDGTVTNVPDGIVVYLSLPVPEHNGRYRSDTITTVKGGKFHFEKAIPAGDDCSVAVSRTGSGLGIKLNPGMRTVISGNGMNAEEWIAENDHPDQKEANIYKKYKKEKLADYLALEVQMHAATAKMYEAQFFAKDEKAAKAASDEAQNIAKQLRSLKFKYFNVMSEFLKNRNFSPSYEEELARITETAYYSDDKEKMNICRELFAKVPKDYMSQHIYFVKKDLYPPFKPLKAGDQVKDFTLNDHDGKPHSIMEYAGKGRYLLLETARKACTGEILDRPKEYLKEIHKKYADKFDIVTIAVCQKAIFDDKAFPREEWVELSLNETSPFEEIQGTYFPKEERFVFISPEGKILAKCGPDKLNEEIKKYFPFVE